MSLRQELREALDSHSKTLGKLTYIFQPSILVMLLLVVLAVYGITSTLVFQFRHPWLTQTERILYLPEALTWQTVEEQKE